MTIKVCIDGSLHDEHDARVSVFDRGFLYGDSVFEVMRTYRGVPFARDEHLARLRRSADKILIPMPVADSVLREEIAQTLASVGNEESYVRVIVTRGTGPLNYDPTTAKDPLRVVIVKHLDAQPPTLYTNGVAVACVRAARPVDSGRAVGTKASNYLANLLAVHDARQRGGYEAILLGAHGEVLEGASSNVFVVDGDVVRTPRLESGILAGITRATVLTAAVHAGIAVVETALFPRDLYDADEVFITSSLREVVPVVRVDQKDVADGVPGPVTKVLHRAFLAEVEGRIATSD